MKDSILVRHKQLKSRAILWEKFRILLLTFLGISCLHQSHQVSKVTTETSLLDTLVGQDSSLIEVYAPYKKKMNEEIHKVLSYAPKHLTRTDGKMQSSLEI